MELTIGFPCDRKNSITDYRGGIMHNRRYRNRINSRIPMLKFDGYWSNCKQTAAISRKCNQTVVFFQKCKQTEDIYG